jgi:uncharacterized protein YlxP (DUF503 family)
VIIGTARVEFVIPESNSLKSRRRVVKSVKDKIRSRFNVSVADVGDQNLWQRVVIGVAVVASDRRFVESVLSKILDLIGSDPRVEVLGSEVHVG